MTIENSGITYDMVCPAGLQFDMNSCVCNHASETSCVTCEVEGSGEAGQSV